MEHIRMRGIQGRHLGQSFGWRLGILLYAGKFVNLVPKSDKGAFYDLLIMPTCALLSKVCGGAIGMAYGAVELFFIPGQRQQVHGEQKINCPTLR
jgi:hypothetical protein